MIRFGPPAASCRVLVFREGMLARLGHDLELDVTRFDVRVDPSARTVDASFDAASLRVARALRDGIELPPTTLSEQDRRTIEDRVRRQVLETNRYPEIRFRSQRATDVPDGFDVVGRLVLHGRERDVVVRLRRADDRYAGEVPLDQPDFGIVPYSALFGGLRVQQRVLVRLSFPPPPA